MLNREFWFSRFDEEFILLPQKAVYWISQQAILVSDLHLGKASHFVKNGISLPSTESKKDLSVISNLIKVYQTKKLFILGDLFHSSINAEWQWFNDFVEENKSVKITLIKGNHDILPDSLFKSLQIDVLPEFRFNQIILSHHPKVAEEEFFICGHIHPGIKLKGKARQVIKLPCFYVTESFCILPAFGSLTGLELVQPKKGDNIYAIANNKILVFKS